MTTDRDERFIDHALNTAAAAALRGDWPAVLAAVDDALLFDPDNGEARRFLTLAEHYLGGGAPGSSRRFESILFADLVGSTDLATRFDPEFVMRLTRAYELAATPVLTGFGGHVHRFVGDGILASFGYPSSHENDSRCAVEAALDLIEAVEATSERFQADGVQLRVRVGIASGILVHNDRGSGAWGQKGDLFGEAVNLAARIHEAALPSQICISPTTAELVTGYFEVEPLGERGLKGFDTPVAIHRVVRRTAARTWVDRRGGEPSPLVGRDVPLRRLAGWWAQARAVDSEHHDRAPVLVTGDPGVGKSRLVLELLADTADTERAAIQLHCEAHREASPLHPIREAIERYSGFDQDDDDRVRVSKLSDVLGASGLDAGEVLPFLGVLLGIDAGAEHPPPELSPTQFHEVILGHLHRWVTAVAERSPTIFVVEDYQWADPSTRDLVGRVLSSRPESLLTILTARTKPAWLEATDLRLLALDALDLEDTRTLVCTIGGDHLQPALLDEITQQSDGIPLFVEHLVDARVGLARGSRSGASAIPLSLMELLQARLDSAGSSKRIAQIAACIGREFEPDLVDAVVAGLVAVGQIEQPERAVPGHLERLLSAGLIERVDGPGLRFRHALLAQAAYESQLLGDRPGRHETIARVLSEGEPGGRATDAAVVAAHFDRGGRPLEAVMSYLAAAQQLQVLGAYEELLEHLRRAEELLVAVDETARPALELGLRLSRGLALGATRGYAAPVKEFERAVELCDALQTVELPDAGVLKALLGLWTYYCVTGMLEQAEDISEAMEQQLERVRLPGGRPSFHACRGVERFFAGDLGASEAHLVRARELFVDDDIDPREWPLPNDPLGAILAFSGPLHLIRGDERRGLEAIDAALERSRSLVFPLGPFTEAFTRAYEAWMHRLRGAADDAAEVASEVLRIGMRHGFFDWVMAGRMHVAAAAVLSAPTPAALDELGESVAVWRAVGAQVMLPTLTLERGWGYVALGELERAEECLVEAEAMMAGGQRLSLSDAHRLRAELAGRRGEPRDLVIAELEAGIRAADRQGAPLFVVRCAESFQSWAGSGHGFDDELRAIVDRAVLAIHDRVDDLAVPQGLS